MRREKEKEKEKGEGEGGGVGMEMERDGASQHDRMTDGLTDEQGGRERERETLSKPPSTMLGSGVSTILGSYTAPLELGRDIFMAGPSKLEY